MADSSGRLNPNVPSESTSPSLPDLLGSLPSDSVASFGERAISASGAAVLSAVIVNPLDVAKTRLQAQAAGIPYYPTKNCIGGHKASRNTNLMFSDFRFPPSRNCDCLSTAESASSLECSRYKGTFDVLFKVARQEGYSRLWRGTNASLALAIPTVGIYLPCYDIFRNFFEEFSTKFSPHLAPYSPLIAGSAARSLACIVCSPIELARTRMQAFRELQTGQKPSGVWKTLLGILSPASTKYPQNIGGYGVLWMGVGAQLARDVPFSGICWSILEPIRRSLLELLEDEGSPITILGANFTAGFAAGSLAAAATCPLDVAKTRRQIQKDLTRLRNSNTWRILSDVWRSNGLKGLFTGVGPRVGRAGPSVGIVVSFYEVVKHVLHRRHKNSSEFMA
ncbi:mitochondrial carrier protein MTM1-like isoform X2 [Phalaenopsis equestris]|uniref:mitochondrial carrier protein MTM1-like isoform X2 n=1 Tax=Phalaenopsis equestris TaxID=78828 RepID=UPI0009E4636C|nr:mitochondrial carrier protein MTM1-like isoform X2 [Phalaenopsis equestris]